MLIAKSDLIKEIDKYLDEEVGIPAVELMRRSGAALEKALRSVCSFGSRVVILCGSGNNGGDGYALATLLRDYKVTLFDMFGKGQRSEEGRFYRQTCISDAKEVITYSGSDRDKGIIASADCIVDAVFGVGFRGEYPNLLKGVAELLRKSKAKKIAVDIPLGVDADTGAVTEAFAYRADITVCLTLLKAGLVSQPARDYCGRVVLDNIGIDISDIKNRFSFSTCFIDKEYALTHLPKREENSSKGSFGKLGMITGSDRYMGAAHLSVEAALRGGVGYVCFFGSTDLCRELRMKYPEVLYNPDFSFEKTLPETFDKMNAVLVGSGVGTSPELYDFVKTLSHIEGAPLVLDADAINSVSLYGSLDFFKEAKRKLILTPHPLEFARLVRTEVSGVQSDRIKHALDFCSYAGDNTVLVLKGSSTLVTDGETLLINSSGSSALAKAGSGDVLAGLLASLVAMGTEPLEAASVAVYYHGIAADRMEKQLSPLGVLPSELPRGVASAIAEDYLIKNKKEC